jgi:HD-like signal output (HDOD) protein
MSQKQKLYFFEVLYAQQKNLYVESVQSVEIFCDVWVNHEGPSQE